MGPREAAQRLHSVGAMRPRFIVHAVIATFLIGGVALAADALVETDEEQLAELAADLTDGRADARPDAVLRWTDLSREKVEVTRGGQVTRFDEHDDHRLAQSVARALAPFAAEDLEVVQRSVSVNGDRATVAVRARAGGEIVNATFKLARSGQGWLVTHLRAS